MNKDLKKISQSYHVSEGTEGTSPRDYKRMVDFFTSVGMKQSSDSSFYFSILEKGLENPLLLTVEFGRYDIRGITIRIWMSNKVVSEKNLKPFGKANVEDVIKELRPHLKMMFEHTKDEIDRLTKDYKTIVNTALTKI